MKKNNKSGIYKIGSFNTWSLIIIIIVIFLSVPQILSKPIIQNKYILGNKIKIDLPGQNVKVQIVTPSVSYLKVFSKSFLFEPKQVGQYRIIFGGGEYQFKVVANSSINNSLNFSDGPGNFSNVVPKFNYSAGNSSFESFYRIVVGKPVRRNRSYSINGDNNFSVNIPSLANNISVKVDGNSTKNYSVNEPFFAPIQRLFYGEANKTLKISSKGKNLSLSYSLPGPEQKEKHISPKSKEVIISAPSQYEYKKVLVNTSISSKLKMNQARFIKVYWKEGKRYLATKALDENNDGFIDHVEWIVPHLSTQHFSVTIEITKAQHLDTNRTFLSDVYSEVKALDGIWSEPINNGEYVRVKFEKNLTNKNDITLYPKVLSGNPKIEVYEKNKDEVIAQFNNLVNNTYNKVYLYNLVGSQDVFDLKIVGGSVEFDHIVDPSTDGDTVAQVYQTNILQDASTEISVQFNNETIVGSRYSHNTNTSLQFNTAGWYKVSYGCVIKEIPIKSGSREEMTGWLDLDGKEVFPSRTYTYLRDSEASRNRGTLSATTLVNASAKSNLTLELVDIYGAEKPDPDDSCWVYAEKVFRPTVLVRETTNYNNNINETANFSQDFGKTVYENSSVFTADLSNNWITVDKSGWYKIYYVAGSKQTSGTNDKDRITVSSFLYKNNTEMIYPSQTYSYHKNADEAAYSTEEGYTMAFLNAGENVSLRRYAPEREQSTAMTYTLNDTWLIMEKLEDNNILAIWDSAGGQEITGSNDTESAPANITWDSNLNVGNYYSHAVGQPNFTINENGLFEISYAVSFNGSIGANRKISCAQLIRNGKIVEPSKLCEYERNYVVEKNSVAGNFIVNNTAGDEYVLQQTVTPQNNGGGHTLVAGGSWITVTPIKVKNVLPPTDPTPEINSTYGLNETTDSLNCFDTINDVEGGKFNVSVRWYKNNVLDSSYDFNNSYPDGTFFSTKLLSGNTSAGENWSCSMRLYDGKYYSNWTNSSNLIIVNPFPFNVNIVSPLSKRYSSTPIDFNVSLSKSGTWCKYSLDNATNVPMTKINSTYFSSRVLVEEGGHNLRVNCNSSDESQINFSQTNFSLDTPTYETVGEWGNVSDLQVGSWKTVTFQKPFNETPVVIHQVNYQYDYDNHPCTTRIKNVTSTGFQIRSESWNPNNTCPSTGVNAFWIAAKKGIHHIADNGTIVRTIEVQNFTMSHSACGSGAGTPNGWDYQANKRYFNNSWDFQPLVLGSVQSANDLDVISYYIKGCASGNTNTWNTTCVQIGLNGMENDGSYQPCNLHTKDEEGGFIAWGMDSNWADNESRDNFGKISNGIHKYGWESYWESDSVQGSQNDPYPLSNYFVSLSKNFPSGAAFGSGIRIDGANGILPVLGFSGNSSKVFELAQEDQFGDSEQSHTAEPWQVLFFNSSKGFLYNNITIPTLQVVSPLAKTYGNSSIDFNVTMQVPVSNCSYSLDGASNVTMNAVNSTYFSKTSTVSDGVHNVLFYCKDTYGNPYSSSITNFKVDTTPFTTNITSPTNLNYSSSSVEVNVSLSKDGSSCEYSLDGLANESMTKFNSTFYTRTESYLRVGNHNLDVYCTDDVGEKAKKSVSFGVKINSTLNVTQGTTSIADGFSETDVPINISDVSKAFVLFSVQSSSSGPSQIQAEAILHKNRIQFLRYSTTGTLNIKYEVIESPNLYVQRGMTVNGPSESLINFATKPVNRSESFVLLSNRLNTGTTSANVQGFWTARLSNSSNIVVQRGTTGSAGEVHYQLVEWNGTKVQFGTENSVGATRSTALPSSINTTRSFVVFSRRLSGATSLEDTSVGGYFSNLSTLNFYRNSAGGTLDIDWFVVEGDEFKVQSGFTSVSSSTAVDQPLASINLSKSFILSGYSSTGTGTTFANNHFTQELFNTTDLHFQKGTNSQTQNVSWFVIEAGSASPKSFINVIQPIAGKYYNTTSLYFNVSTTNDASTCKYSLDGAPNTSMASLNATYFYNLQTGLSESSHSVIFYCTDTLSNNYSSSNMNFHIDLTSPSPIQVSPGNATIINTTNTIKFAYNVSDNFGVRSCSLYSNGVLRWIDSSPSIAQTNTFEAYIPNGVQKWHISCVDNAGNTNVSTNRTLTVNAPQSYSWNSTWYETSTNSYSGTVANINLNNTRDNVENQVAYTIPASTLSTITVAKSPFLANKGAIIPASTTISFSSFISATSSNVAYITWKVYSENMTGKTLICQSGDDLTGGTRISSASGTWTGSCTSPSSDFVFKESDRIRLEVNVYNAGGSEVNVTHVWDNLRLSSVGLGALNLIGSLTSNLSSPNSDQNLNVGDKLNVSCDVNCSIGNCYGTNVYLQYNDSNNGWQNVSSTGNLVLEGSETNPHNLGDLVAGSTTTNFTVKANSESKNNLRCQAVGTYDSNYTNSVELNISPYPQIYFSGSTPANATDLLSDFFNTSVSINDTNLENYVFNFNGINYTFLKDKLNFIYSGISTSDTINSSDLVYNSPMSVYPNDSNLALAWTFNNDSNFVGGNSTVVDFAGYDNNGTINGATYDPSGKYGQSMSFNGRDFVRANSFSSLNGESTATISAWVKQDSNSENQYLLWADGNVLIQFGDNYNIPGTTNLRMRWNLDGAWQNSHTAVGVLDTNVWHNWIFVFDHGNTSIYKDGVNVYNGTDAQTSITATSPDYDLGYRSDASRGLNGSVDNFMIWNRTLSPEEISAIGKSNLQKNSSTPWTHFVNVKNLPDGTYTYYGYAKNKEGNSNMTDVRYITINTSQTSPPRMTIISPESNKLYNTSTLNFNVSLDRTGDWCGYSLDGASNVTMTKINSTYFSKTSTISDGIHEVVFSCNSTFGIMGTSSSTKFKVDSTNPVLSFVSPTPADGATKVVNNTSINITVAEDNLQKFSLGFNNSNTSFYDPNLVLMMNLNNNSALGENSTSVVDSSAYSNDGIFKGNAHWNSSGKYSSAAEFDGTNDWVDVPNKPSLQGMKQFTFEGWVYDTANDSQPRGIASKRIDSGSTSFAIFMYTNRYLYFDIGSSADRHDSGTAIPANQWTHVAVTFNGSAPSSQRKKFYINGHLVSTTSSSQTTIPETASNLTLGILNKDYGTSWKGLLDEIKIYNRTLSDSEIKKNYQSNFHQVSSNSWNLFTNVTNLSDGIYNYSGYAKDKAGHSSVSGIRSVTIAANAVPPRIKLNLPFSNTVSSVSNVNFNFTVLDNYDSSLTCNLSVGSIQDNGFSVANNTLTNRLLTNLPDGIFNWNVSCVNSAGATNTSDSRQIEISEKPSVSLNTINGTWFNDEVQLGYTPSDNSNLSNCSLYLDGNYDDSNTSTIANREENDFFVFGASDGLHNYYVNCTDTSGLTNVSETRFFYHDAINPRINLSVPLDGAQIYAANITFNWTPTDNLAKNFFCNLTVDGSVVDSNIGVSNNTLVSRVKTISAGAHFWNVTCVDNATNSYTSETRNFTNFLPPEVTLDTPSNDTWLNSQNINFVYNVFDQDDNIANCSIYLDGVLNQTNSTPIINGALNNFTVNEISEGNHNWTVKCIDKTNLVGTDIPRNLHIDTKKPTIVLNSPLNSEVLTWNNITFNWSSTDNLASSYKCDLVVDNFPEISGISVINNTDTLENLLKSDGTYSYYVNCTDLANNTQTSPNRTFNVSAPPIISLTSPSNNNITKQSTVTFTYVPRDAIGIVSCNLLVDGVVNQTDTSIIKNTNNSFTPVKGLSEGNHNWTVNCTDSDYDTGQAGLYNLTVDQSPPVISLDYPFNNSGIYYDKGTIVFKWTATDTYDPFLRCDLNVDGTKKVSDMLVSSGVQATKPISLFEGEHKWNITCRDEVGNSNSSSTYRFNFTYPDFMVNSSSITFNNTSPQENSQVKVNVKTYNFGGADIPSVNVSLYNGTPSGVNLIGINSISISKYSSNITSFIWSAQIGTTQIYAVVDPPLSTNGSYKEWNESNNEISKNITVGSWQYLYGHISPESNYTLSNTNSSSLVVWPAKLFSGGNIFVTDSSASVSWPSLYAIGRSTLGTNESNDFSDIDTLLGMSGYNDSVKNVYTSSDIPKNTSQFLIFQHPVSNVPVAISINSTNFTTGIVWDSSDDASGNHQFDTTDKEDLVFMSKIHPHTKGTYGVYDYEIRIPARLRNYHRSSSTATIYVELI